MKKRTTRRTGADVRPYLHRNVNGVCVMMDRVLKEITVTELQAAEIERRSITEAAAILQEARSTARRMLDEGLGLDAQRISEKLAVTEADAAQETATELAASSQAAEARAKVAEARMDAAVACIVKGVMDTYGHR